MKKNVIVGLVAGILAVVLGAWYLCTGCGCCSLETKLDKYVEACVKQGTFNGSVLVAQNGKIVLCKGYGMANYELGVPNTPQTRFMLASVTKQFTSMAIMQLQEKGLLRISDPVSKYIPDYPQGDKITIHHLLTHTSGIPDYSKGTTPKSLGSLEKMLDYFKDKPLEFEPGAKYNYSNSGYILLGCIIEKASKQTLDSYMQEYIFKPLSMANTNFFYDPTDKSNAVGYELAGLRTSNLIDSQTMSPVPYVDMSLPLSDGNLISTVEDLYRWDRGLYSEVLLNSTSRAQLFAPAKDGHGYGWGISENFGRKVVRHSGRVEGFSTYIARYPDDNVCIILLSNFERCPVGFIAYGLAAIVFGEKYDWPKKRVAIKLDPAIYDQYVGNYRVSQNLVIAITKQDDKLFAAAGQVKHRLYPESETQFFHHPQDENVQMTFVKDANGRVTKLILHEVGKDQVAEKI